MTTYCPLLYSTNKILLESQNDGMLSGVSVSPNPPTYYSTPSGSYSNDINLDSQHMHFLANQPLNEFLLNDVECENNQHTIYNNYGEHRTKMECVMGQQPNIYGVESNQLISYCSNNSYDYQIPTSLGEFDNMAGSISMAGSIFCGDVNNPLSIAEDGGNRSISVSPQFTQNSAEQSIDTQFISQPSNSFLVNNSLRSSCSDSRESVFSSYSNSPACSSCSSFSTPSDSSSSVFSPNVSCFEDGDKTICDEGLSPQLDEQSVHENKICISLTEKPTVVDILKSKAKSACGSKTKSKSKISKAKNGGKRKSTYHDKPDNHICPICNEYLVRDLPRHMRIHEPDGRFKCPFPRHLCRHKRGQFNRKYDFKKHLLHTHFRFDYDKIVNRFKNLNSKLGHEGVCVHCGRRSTGEDWLENHILTSDENKRCKALIMERLS